MTEPADDRLKSLLTRFDDLKPLRITERDFKALPEYSCSKPTGVTHGKRWRRHDGAHDRSCPVEARIWVVCEYEVVEQHRDGTVTYRTHWFRPLFQGEPVMALVGDLEGAEA